MSAFRRTSISRRRLFAILACCATASALILYVLPSLLVGPDKDLTTAERLKAENDVRTTLLQGLVGAVLLSGLYFTGLTYVLNREGQVTERFTRAIDQLGNKESLDVRLGGIYALERIAQESPRDHWPIFEVLTAFVRERAPGARAGADEALYPKPDTDVQAVLTALCRREWTRESGDQRLDLRQTDLRGAMLRGAHLSGANLSYAHLEQADLVGANLESADLAGAEFEASILKEVRLANADLTMANLSHVDVTPTIGLTAEQVRNTRVNRYTKVPPEMRSKLPPGQIAKLDGDEEPNYYRD